MSLRTVFGTVLRCSAAISIDTWLTLLAENSIVFPIYVLGCRLVHLTLRKATDCPRHVCLTACSQWKALPWTKSFAPTEWLASNRRSNRSLTSLVSQLPRYRVRSVATVLQDQSAQRHGNACSKRRRATLPDRKIGRPRSDW